MGQPVFGMYVYQQQLQDLQKDLYLISKEIRIILIIFKESLCIIFIIAKGK